MRNAEEVSKAIDDILARCAVKFGREVKDEETGELIGFQMELPADRLPYDIDSVCANRDEKNHTYQIGVVLKANKDRL